MTVWHLEARTREKRTRFLKACFSGTFEVPWREEVKAFMRWVSHRVTGQVRRCYEARKHKLRNSGSRGQCGSASGFSPEFAATTSLATRAVFCVVCDVYRPFYSVTSRNKALCHRLCWRPSPHVTIAPHSGIVSVPLRKEQVWARKSSLEDPEQPGSS